MPSIEILVVKPEIPEGVDFSGFEMAIRTSSPPVSHRSPSLWQGRFAEIGGTLFHLGNPRLKEREGYCFFAYDLIEEEDMTTFGFKAEYESEIERLLRTLLSFSRVGKVVFTMDWQFGNETPFVSEKPIPLSQFLRNMTQRNLPTNCWFEILSDGAGDHAAGEF